MTNETKIKVPKKYQGIVESIRYNDNWRGKYVLCAATLPAYYSNSQADILEMIRLTYAAIYETVPAPAPEEPAAKEELTNVEETANGKYTVSGNDSATAVSSESTFNCLENLVVHSSRHLVEQDHIPFAVAADEASARSDQEATAPVVDDQRVVFTNCIHKNHEGYCNLHSDGIDYLEPCVEGPCPDECIPLFQPP